MKKSSSTHCSPLKENNVRGEYFFINIYSLVESPQEANGEPPLPHSLENEHAKKV